jgi:hypothetical protein
MSTIAPYNSFSGAPHGDCAGLQRRNYKGLLCSSSPAKAKRNSSRSEAAGIPCLLVGS